MCVIGRCLYFYCDFLSSGIQKRQSLGVAGGRPQAQALLSATVSPRQVLPGPQDLVLRRGAFPVLRDDMCRH